jgi:hypothetical protein
MPSDAEIKRTVRPLQKEIKCAIRNRSSLLHQWKEEEISFSRMAEELSKTIKKIVEDYTKSEKREK